MGRPMNDYAGHKFNKLTTVEFDHSASKNAYYWKFICDCGKDVIANIHDVRRGKIQSCGCIKRKLTEDEAGFRRTLGTYIDQARSRNLVWEISTENARLLFKAPCTYCGALPSNHRQRSHSRDITYVYSGIDRRDNAKGYTEGNTVSCCSMCNRMKLNHTEDEFLAQAKRIVEHMEKRHG